MWEGRARRLDDGDLEPFESLARLGSWELFKGTLQIDLQRRNKILGKIELVGWCVCVMVKHREFSVVGELFCSAKLGWEVTSSLTK
jgi:hypothetical protein